MSIAGTRKKTIGSNIDKMKGVQITDLLVPGLFILVFSLLTFFVFIPNVQDTMDMRDELEVVQGNQDTLSKNLEQMRPLIDDRASLYRDLVTTKKILPKKLDVADFAYFVTETARSSGLIFQEIDSGSSERVNNSNSQSGYGDYVGSVSGSINYEGSYEDVVTFLDRLQDESPYIVEVLDLELGGDQENDRWSLELDLSGYFIPEEIEIETGVIYSEFVPYTRKQDLMDLFNYKANILDENPDDKRDEEGNYLDK